MSSTSVPIVTRGEPIDIGPDLRLAFVGVALPEPGNDQLAILTLLGLREGIPVAHLKLDLTDGEVLMVFVDDEYRHRGIGTLMWKLAGELAAEHDWPAPRHSANRTIEGDGWAKAVGGEVPEPSGDLISWLHMDEVERHHRAQQRTDAEQVT